MEDEPKQEEDQKTEEVEKSDVEKVEEDYEILKAANDKVAAELLRSEELKAKIAVGGKALGATMDKEVIPETDEEYAARFDRGEVDLTK